MVVKGYDEIGNHDYYDVLTNIIQLDYFRDNNIFCSSVFDEMSAKKVEEPKEIKITTYTSVNFTKKWKTNEPFELTPQVEQVFYCQRPQIG